MYGHVITKFSGMGRFTYQWGSARAWSSAINSYALIEVFRYFIIFLDFSDLGKNKIRSLPPTPRQNVYACARLSISGLFFYFTFQSDQSLPRALGFDLCAACGSVVLLHTARVFDCFVVIEIAFMDNQAQITETIS